MTVERPSQPLEHVKRDTLGFFPASMREMVPWGTPDRLARSAWDQPRPSRNFRVRILMGVIVFIPRIFSERKWR